MARFYSVELCLGCTLFLIGLSSASVLIGGYSPKGLIEVLIFLFQSFALGFLCQRLTMSFLCQKFALSFLYQSVLF